MNMNQQQCNDVNTLFFTHLKESAKTAYTFIKSNDLFMLKFDTISSDPLATNLLLVSFFITLCYITGFLTGQYSSVDKLWSITPMIYSWVFVLLSSNGPTPLGLTACVVVSLWAFRLTLNFNRRGGYAWPPWQGEEDYRWPFIRSFQVVKDYPWLMEIFHFVFICTYQHLLLFLISFPIYLVTLCSDKQMSPATILLTFVFLTFLVLESIADNEQYAYQTEKYFRKGVKDEDLITGTEYSIGFVTEGLWAYCRHPNVASEQSIWVTLYLYSVFATESPFINWFGLGAFLLVMLLHASTHLTEYISSSKYPKYKVYQDQVPMFLPYGSGFAQHA